MLKETIMHEAYKDGKYTNKPSSLFLYTEEKKKYAREVIKKCKEEYGFESETIVPIFQRIYYSTERQSRLNKYNREYMLGMASVWNRNNIKTKEDIENYYKNLYNEIFNIISRDLTTYEKICIEDLIYKYRVKERDIIDKIKEKGKLDINELRMLEN